MAKITQLPPDTTPAINDLIALVNNATGLTSKMTLSDFSTLMKTLLMPSGLVQQTAATAAPSGWLLCDGSAINRSAYAALFTAIGTTYGAGDGSLTFNIPDARGRVAAGKDNMGGTAASRLTATSYQFGNNGMDGTVLGGTGGQQGHTHLQTIGADPNTTYQEVDGAGSGHTTVVTTDRVTFGNSGRTTAGSRQDGTYDASTLQPTIILNYIIKT